MTIRWRVLNLLGRLAGPLLNFMKKSPRRKRIVIWLAMRIPKCVRIRVVLWLAQFARDEGYSADAIRALRAGVTCAPNDYRIRMALGNVLVSVKEYREAAKHYKVIPPGTRQYRDAQYGLAVCSALGNDPYAAIPYLIATLETDITHELALARLLETLRDEKEYARMEEYALRRMQHPPYPEWLHVALAEVYQQAGDESRAQQPFSKFKDSSIDLDKESAFWGLVKAYLIGDTLLMERSLASVERHCEGMEEYMRRRIEEKRL